MADPPWRRDAPPARARLSSRSRASATADAVRCSRRLLRSRVRRVRAHDFVAIENGGHHLRLVAALQMRLDPFGVQLHPLEVLPDARVARAAVAAADRGTAGVGAAESGGAIAMRAEAVGVMADLIRPAEIPSDGAAFHFLRGEREIELAADGVADVHPLGAIHRD